MAAFAAYGDDDRRTLALMLLPVMAVALAIGFGQATRSGFEAAWRAGGPGSDIAGRAPARPASAPSRTSSPSPSPAPAPAPAAGVAAAPPPLAMPVPSSRRSVAVATDAPVILPPAAPAVALPDIRLPGSAPPLAAAPPSLGLDLLLSRPALSLPSAAPATAALDRALAVVTAGSEGPRLASEPVPVAALKDVTAPAPMPRLPAGVVVEPLPSDVPPSALRLPVTIPDLAAVPAPAAIAVPARSATPSAAGAAATGETSVAALAPPPRPAVGPAIPPAATATPLPPLSPGGADVCVPEPKVVRARVAAPSDPDAFGRELAAAALAQTREFVVYNDKYRRIAYPMGDVSPFYGVCTDVVIRAYRALDIDLQALVQVTRTGSGDPNIDHRRVDTLRRFFAAHGQSLPVTEYAEDYRPGDVVSYWRPQNRHSRTHIAIVADQIGPSGRPMIIHNRGWGPQIEDGLFVDQITGHYRFSGLGKTPRSTVKSPPRPPLTPARATSGPRREAGIAGRGATP